MPDRSTGSCPDPELPKTGLQERGEKGPGPPPPALVKRVSWNPAEMGETGEESEKNLFQK